MGGKTLVAYASKCGSTAEVAEAIGHVLQDAGRPVDIRKVQDVRDLEAYRAVILGTAIRMGRPLSDATVFARRFRLALNQMPVALFSVGAQMREDTDENRKKTLGFLSPLLSEVKQPARVGMFGGRVENSQLSPLWRMLSPRDKSGMMHEGDWRNWEAIHGWARDLNTVLAGV